ncbi:RNA-binding domain-containing protein [Tannerella forsythia]|uniref:RNA-binding domain-containing protein n=1 Tax=Tannerella forsythia TaxID=28112 RepID=UPI0028EF28AF|nr:RNA-binding domain-containing protein [Tannerella forsythia]
MDILYEDYTNGRAFMRMINATEEQVALFEELSKKAVYKSSDSDFMSLLKTGSPFWIFAFLKALDRLYEKCREDTDRTQTILSLYIRIEEHLLENRRFLNLYPENKHSSILFRAEQMLHKAYAHQEALSIIQENKVSLFISDLSAKTEIPDIHIYNLEKKINILMYLFLYDPQALMGRTIAYLRLFRFFIEYASSLFSYSFWINNLESLIKKECDRIDTILLTGEITAEIRQKAESLIQIAGAEFLISRAADSEINIVHRLMFYRYLYLLDERRTPALKNLMLSTFLKRNSRPPEYTWEELILFSFPLFVDKISYFIEDILENKNSFSFEGNGVINLSDQRITLSPHPNPLIRKRNHKLLSLWEDTIKINTFHPSPTDLNSCTDIHLLYKAWNTAFDDFKAKPVFEQHHMKETPPAGTSLKVRITKMNPAYPLLAFASIEDDRYEGYGVLHASQVSRVKLNTLSDIFVVGDLVTAHVLETSDNRLSFSILEEIGFSISARFHKDDYTYAKLLAQKENLDIWVSEKGYPLYTLPSPDTSSELEIDDIYMLRLTSVYKNGYVKAEIEEAAPEDVTIDTSKAVADLISYYIDERTEDYDADESKMDNSINNFYLESDYVRQLIYIIDLHAESTQDHILRFNLFNTTRLLAKIVNSSSLESYYTYRILYLKELHKFLHKKTMDDAIIDDAAVQQYPRLSKPLRILSMLSAKNDSIDCVATLQTQILSNEKQISDLARLLLIQHFARTAFPDIAKSVNAKILALLAIEEGKAPAPQTENINFGREGNTKEFKSTIVYPPESNHEADIDKQMEHILTTICGFLNADGGILYIGVNDIGYPRGIETDLNYLRCNEDKYQLLIRKYIVKDLGKDINSLILIDFHSFNEKTVCAVSVPSYHQAVSYKGIVWQRQGNSTRPLDTPEIRLLKERRSALILSKKNTETPFKELENTSADQADNIFPVNIPTYKLPVESAHPLPQTEVPPIYTSVLKTNKEQEAIAFFSILESGKFMLSKEFPYQHNTRIALPLYDEYLSGYLLYIYENGFVNRIAVSTLMSKKQNYEYTNALFDKSSLFFTSFAKPDDSIFVKIAYKGNEYIRVLSQKNIKINTDLSLKGTPLYTIPFGKIIQTEVLNKEQAQEVEKIHSELSTTLGTPVSSISAIKEIYYLNNLLSGKSTFKENA